MIILRGDEVLLYLGEFGFLVMGKCLQIVEFRVKFLELLLREESSLQGVQSEISSSSIMLIKETHIVDFLFDIILVVIEDGVLHLLQFSLLEFQHGVYGYQEVFVTRISHQAFIEFLALLIVLLKILEDHHPYIFDLSRVEVKIRSDIEHLSDLVVDLLSLSLNLLFKVFQFVSHHLSLLLLMGEFIHEVLQVFDFYRGFGLHDD